MATQQVKKTERQNVVTSRRVPVRSIPSTFARTAFPLGGIGTGNVSLGARGELRDWELVNSPAKGRQNANAFFAIHARPKGGVAVNRVLEARGGDPKRDQQGGFQVFELTDPSGNVYVMQSYSQQVDPSLSLRKLPDIGPSLGLEEGWSYAARRLSEDLTLTAAGSTQIVNDTLANTYQINPAAD